MSKFIDIHTHNFKADTDVISLINLFPEDIPKTEVGRTYTLGVHPWHVDYQNINKVIEFSGHRQISAIGEIGLDKLHHRFELQKDIFRQQIRIAKDVEKPVILHCVKACSEILQILKEEKFDLPVIFHRFGGGTGLARQLTDKSYFLSFGQVLFQEKNSAVRAFKKTDLKHIFLETDDADISVKNIYTQAAYLKNIDIEILKKAIFENYKRIFPNQI